MLQCTGPVAILTRVQFWSRVRILTGPVHWSTGPNPYPFINLFTFTLCIGPPLTYVYPTIIAIELFMGLNVAN
jgi:hypothetical protein